jgi:hypothetical protein
MVNRLLTIFIRVNIAPSAESNLSKGARRNEEDSGEGWLLELAYGFWLERSRRQRLKAFSSSTSKYKIKELRALAERRALLF